MTRRYRTLLVYPFALPLFLLASCVDQDNVPKVRIESGPPLAWGLEPAARIKPATSGVYVVQPGDTLWAVAAVHGVEVQDLARWNRIQNPDQLWVGQGIVVKPPEDENGEVDSARLEPPTASESDIEDRGVKIEAQDLDSPPGVAGVGELKGKPEPVSKPVAVVGDKGKTKVVPNSPILAGVKGRPEPAPRAVVVREVAPKMVAPREVAPREVAPKMVAPREVAPKAVAPSEVAPKAVASKEKEVEETRERDAESPTDSPPKARNVPVDVGDRQQVAKAAWQLPAEAPKTWLWPHGGKVVGGFGSHGARQSNGIDISVREGDPVVAAADGIVAYADDSLPGYGNLILLRHGGSYTTAYAHNQKTLVKRGQVVKAGEKIALAGKSGGLKQPLLHFELRYRIKPLNPAQHLARRS